MKDIIWQTPSGQIHKGTPDFSTNTADAFIVVEEMRRKGFAFKLEVTEKIATAFFKKDDIEYSFASDLSPNQIAHAICIASLNAIREEEH